MNGKNESTKAKNSHESQDKQEGRVTKGSDSKGSNIYATYALLSGLFLGLISAYLFFWKVPGVSVSLFALVAIGVVLLPLLTLGGKEIMKRVGWNALPAMLGLSLAFVYLYRLNPAALALGVIFLPMVYSMLYVAAFNPEMLNNLGILKTMVLPFVMVFSWFVDIVNFVQNIKLGGIKSERSRSVIRRVLLGTAVALPFLLVFLVMFTAADRVFAKYVMEFFESIFGEIFKDWETFTSFVVKAIFSALIAIYFMVFNFSLYNENSALRKYIRKTEQPSVDIKRNWDGFTVSIFLTLINVLFFLFVAVQFYYLFAGEQNILGSDANFTYAQYARRGFVELLIVAVIVFGIGYVLNLKTNAVGKLQRIFFTTNYVLLLLFTFIISISAHMRLGLVESTYGITGLRLTGHYIYLVIDILLLLLAVALLVKERAKFAAAGTIAVLLASIAIYFMTPIDLVVAQMNYERFKNDGKVDLSYLTTLSDEAIPVLVAMYYDDEMTPLSRTLLGAHLEQRYDEIKDQRKLWQEFNILDRYNKQELKKIVEDESSLVEDAEEGLREFLDDYSEALEAGNYKEAHERFWSENTRAMRDEEFDGITVTSYEYTSIPEFEYWYLLGDNARQLWWSDDNYDYWTGMYVYANMRYSFVDDYGYRQYGCRSDSLRVKIENGEWKIMYADSFNLGRFEDAGNSSYYSENDSLEHLKELPAPGEYDYGYDDYDNCY
ncbi:MAG: DUF4173 domain-containing protein [Candidatus Dojkabacteria bacterium]|nr:MAG: DUF4173 domain-containing protein [Candidatus Dojkabacteria bacterium]